jgi:hypothetical protein
MQPATWLAGLAIVLASCTDAQFMAFQPAAAMPQVGQPITPKAWQQWFKPTTAVRNAVVLYAVTYKFGILETQTVEAKFLIPDGLHKTAYTPMTPGDLIPLIDTNVRAAEAPSYLHQYRSDGPEDIKVPAGEFKDCLRVSRQDKDARLDSVEWYRAGIGLIKARHTTTVLGSEVVETAELLGAGASFKMPPSSSPTPAATPSP